MNAWSALLWGGLASSSLFIGQALAGPLAGSRRAVGLLMGFGAGTLISAVGYQLVPQASFEQGFGVGISFALGAITYYLADRIVDGRGGEDRQSLDVQADSGSPWAMFIGALLDGLPESFVLGITLALGGAIDAAFLAAVFVSNIPQGVAGTASLRAAGATSRRITWGWAILTAASAGSPPWASWSQTTCPPEGIWAEAFAGSTSSRCSPTR